MTTFNDYENRLVFVAVNGVEMSLQTYENETGVFLCQKAAGKDWENVGKVSCKDATNAVQKMLSAGGRITKETTY